jgi:putative transposase
MQLNEVGRIVCEEWRRTAEVRADVVVDEFVVMPNHVHGVLALVGATRRVALGTEAALSKGRDGGGNRPRGPAPGSIGAIVGQIKSVATKRINRLRGTPGAPIWQRNYYDRIPRTDDALSAVREYIRRNPTDWTSDMDNPKNPRFLAANRYPDGWIGDVFEGGGSGER